MPTSRATLSRNIRTVFILTFNRNAPYVLGQSGTTHNAACIDVTFDLEAEKGAAHGSDEPSRVRSGRLYKGDAAKSVRDLKTS